jgi:hypothetical protein
VHSTAVPAPRSHEIDMQDPENNFPFMRNFVQFGYVTNDIDAAIASLSASCGVARWRRGNDIRLRVRADTHCTIKAALAYVGPTMIELIQPIDGDMSLYGTAVPGDEPGSIKLHHLAYGVTSAAEWDRLVHAVEKQQVKVTKVDDPDLPLRTLYVDFGFGHHCEFLLLDAAGKKLFATVPQNLPESSGS